MSIQAMAQVFETDVGDPSAKLLLICIANAHNTSTGICCPSIARLQTESCMGRSTVKRWLRWLEEQRYIQVIPTHDRNGRQQAHTYRLTLGEGSKLDHSEGSKLDPVQTGLGVNSEPGEGSICEPPLKEPEEEPLPPQAPLTDEFALIIEAWPKLKDKDRNEAWEAFGDLPVGDKAKLITAARRYPDECREEAARRGRTMDQHVPYTKGLPNWIRERRWEGSKPLPSTAGHESLNRHSSIYAACCRIEGKTWALEAQSCMFKASTVAKARDEALAMGPS